MKKLQSTLFITLFFSAFCFAQLNPTIDIQLVESIGPNINCSGTSDCVNETGCFSIQVRVDQAGWALASYSVQVQYNWTGLVFPANFMVVNAGDYLSDFSCFIPAGGGILDPDTLLQQFRVGGAGGALTDILVPGVFTPIHEVCFEWVSVNGADGAVYDDVNGQSICAGGTGQFGFLSPITLQRSGGITYNDPNVTQTCLVLDNTTFTCLQNALPIELTSFTGVKIGEKIKLDWKTETEIENDYFEVQRSVNGSNFETIGTVDGSGTTFERQVYRFWDESLPQDEILYYRLKQVDFDGRFDYSNVVVINNAKISDEINIYPNPASDYALITGQNIERIRLFSSDGKLIMEQQNTTGIESINLNLKGVPKGFYLVKINDNVTHELIIE